MLPLKKISTLWQQKSVNVQQICKFQKLCSIWDEITKPSCKVWGQMFQQPFNVRKKKKSLMLQHWSNSACTEESFPCCHRLSSTWCLTGATTEENFTAPDNKIPRRWIKFLEMTQPSSQILLGTTVAFRLWQHAPNRATKRSSVVHRLLGSVSESWKC